MARRPPRDWSGLQSGIAGRVLLPHDGEFESARRSFIARFDDIRPRAIVRGRTAHDFAVALRFAQHHGLPVAIRSGGHSAAGYSSTRGILLDLGLLSSLSVRADAVTVGAGARTGHLCERLAKRGLTVPVGTCPTVGIGGLALGGGFGSLGRKYGLTLDHLLGVRIVLAGGDVLDCDERRSPDLFWALRGAGCGNFGVVTHLKFRALAIPQTTCFEVGWAPEHAATVIAAWQVWAPAAADELNAEMTLDSVGECEQRSGVHVYGVYLGGAPVARVTLDRFLQQAGAPPRSCACVELPYLDALHRLAASSTTGVLEGAVSRQGYRVMKSELFRRELPHPVIADLVDGLYAGTPNGQHRSVEFAPLGGAYNRRAPAATAFAHRCESYSIQHSALVDPMASPEAKQAAHEWVTRSWQGVRSCASGSVYQNFPDPELTDWCAAYYGASAPRLTEVKRRYDPENVFRFEQSIRLR